MLQRSAVFGLILLLVTVLTAWVSPRVARADIDPHFKPLVKRLAADGLDKEWLEKTFDRPCVKLMPKVLSLRLTVRESKIDYDGYLQAEPIAKSRKFMENNKEVLRRAEEEFGAPAELVTAILLLETRFGEYTGGFQTLSTLATHASAGRKAVTDLVYDNLPAEAKTRWSRSRAALRLAGRKEWSYNELKSFLNHLQKLGAEPCSVRGSYTGAQGLCQFQPSNIKPYGRDGDQDGKVNLHQVEDAVFSAAAYLKAHGWKENLSPAGKLAVIKRYNNSTPYARTILEVARKLK